MHKTDVIRGLHASPHRFDFPDYDRMVAHRQNHENGNLGLWVATGKADWIRGFGEHRYQVEVCGKVMDIPVKELMAWDREAMQAGGNWYTAKHDELLANGVDYLRIVEQDGQSDMGVVVNFQAITVFQLDSVDPRPARSHRKAQDLEGPSP